MSIAFQGTSVSEGICMAKVFVISKKPIHIPNEPAGDTEAEIRKFRNVVKTALEELHNLYEKTLLEIGREEAEIFDAHQTFLKDEVSVCLPIEELIHGKNYNAAKAIEIQFDSIIEMFSSLDDQLMRERAADAADMKNMLLHLVLGVPRKQYNLTSDVIILTDDLSPSETVKMNLSHVLGIATRSGGVTSHTSIIANNLGIPAVTGISGWESMDLSGAIGILDGVTGILKLFPSEEDILDFRRAKEKNSIFERELEPFRRKPTETSDGIYFEIYANIGIPADTENALTNGAEGIGLFRTEFLFMDRGDTPSEEEQLSAYRQVLSIMGDRPVIIRTLDVGGDKHLPALGLPKEENPFLGYRAIRVCLDQPNIFKPQLRALLRAGVYGNLHVMFPMVSCLEEFRAAKEQIEEARHELQSEGIPFGEIKVGLMVEIPSVALMADKFAEEADFFSIGTNDLIQYTVAVERGNAKIEKLYSPYHPAVLKLIFMAAKAASNHGIPFGICGEAAGDSRLTPIFLGMGVTELSMSPRLIPRIRKYIHGLSMDKCREVTQHVLELNDMTQVREYLNKQLSA
jgi:phosphotransferase system enzyme I (PtsI)